MKDYEQIITTLLAKIAELEKIVQQQAARIAELEKGLNKNSSNSSKPPSSDGLSKPPRQRLVTNKEAGSNQYIESGVGRFISFLMLDIVPLQGDSSMRSG